MSRKIVVEPSKLESAAAKMDAQASEYERQYNLLFNEVDGLSAAWQGGDNVTFSNQIKGFMDDFQKMKELMQQYSEYLKFSAKTYREAQNETINAARRLTN